jgi:hypothetical protein
MTMKATLYLEEDVYRALKVKAAQTDQTVSATANAMISHALAERPSPTYGVPKVHIKKVGPMGFPVLNIGSWPEGYVFDREKHYD